MKTWLRCVGVVLGGAALLSACTLSNVASDYAPEGKGNLGVVVVSVGRAGATEFDLSTKFTPLGGGSSYLVVVDDDLSRADFGKVERPAGPNGSGSQWGYALAANPLERLVVAALPAGDYEVATLSGKSPRFKTSQSAGFMIHSDPLGLRFTVRPGQVTYLGSVVFAFPDWMAQSQYKGPLRIVTSDTSVRDAKVVQERYPKLGANPVERGLIQDPGGVRHYYLNNLPDGGRSRD